jgi:4-amino-4-deoxy-L-arabinose transferase-like glycosyltransferase
LTNFKKILIIVVAVLAVRIVFFPLLAKSTKPAIDGTDYVNIAKSIKNDFSFSYDDNSPAFQRAPLFPAVIAGLFLVFGENEKVIPYFNALVFALSIAMLFSLLPNFIGKYWGGLFVLISSFYFPLIKINYLLMSETLGLFLITLFIFCWSKKPFNSHILAYIVLGFLMLVKPVTLFLPFLIMVAKRKQIKSYLLMTLIPFLIISPWTIRNYSHTNKLIPVASGSGVVLYVGSDPVSMGKGDLSIDGKTGYDRAREIAKPYDVFKDWRADSILTRAALKNVTNSPFTFLSIMARKFFRLWGISTLYYGKKKALVAIPINLAFMLLTVFSIFKLWTDRKNEPYSIMVLVLLYYSVMHMVIYSKPRFGLPLFPVVIFLSTIGLFKLKELVKNRRN